MKIIVSIISSLLVGLALASANFSPIHEIQYILGQRRRLFAALGTAVTGYLFIVAAVLIAVVEAALQYDVQGFFMWSSLFTACLVLALAGAACLLVARVMFAPISSPQPQHSLFAELNQQFNFKEMLEAAVQNLADSGRRAQEAGRPEAEPPVEDKFKESQRSREGARERTKDEMFKEAPAAEMLQH